MQGQFHIDMATGYMDRRDEELAIDRSRRHASAPRHGPSPSVRERFGRALIHAGMRLVPTPGFVRTSRPGRV
jgi:hypothetical protein